jgi:DNA helicase HerA-like ATPase
MSKPTVVDLEALSDDDEKALIMAFLLTLLYEQRVAEGDSPHIKHVTVIEEAHRLLSSMNLSGRSNSPEGNQSEDSKTKAIRLFMDMLAEIRAYGEGIVIVEQIPTKLISDAIKNTNLKIMHRITSRDDREYLGEAMNFDEQQKRFVTNLRRGEAVVFEEHLDHPVLIKVDPRKP